MKSTKNGGARLAVYSLPALLSIANASSAAEITPGALATQVQFDQPAPLAANDALLERLLTPRQRARQLEDLAAHGRALALYSLDLDAERFSVYVPKYQPENGYALLAFIPPWDDAHLPLGWSHELERAGMIFVSAARSGNDTSIQARRIPLALDAVHALSARYRIDPERIYVGGFSGGARVALRAALAYPDVFAGALLDAGSDPIGNASYPLPRAELMQRLQTHSRIILLSGENDTANVAQDVTARASLADWCIQHVHAIVRTNAGHDVMDGNALAEALAAASRPAHAMDDTRCNVALEKRLAHARADATVLRAAAPGSHGQERLDQLDQEYGALLVQPATP